MPSHIFAVSWCFHQNGGAAILGGPDETAPVLQEAEVGSVAADILVLDYNEGLDSSSVPATGDFSLSGTTETVSSVAVTADKVRLTLSGDVSADDTVLVSYTAGVNPIRDVSENEAANLTNQAVTNNVLSQYIVYVNDLVTPTPASTIYNDGVTKVRKRVASTAYYIDIALTVTGFAGIENTDWIWVNKINGTTSVFRSGVRSSAFVIDGTLDATGFAGAEDVNWENLSATDGGGVLTTFRDGVRDEGYVIDKVLTATGFAGAEDTDWENIGTYKAI